MSSQALISLASRSRRARVRRLVMEHTLALGNVPFGGGLVELSSTMRALDVIAGIAGGWLRQITQLPTCRYVYLRLLGVADRGDEVVVLAPPVRLQLRLFLVRLEQRGNVRLLCRFKGGLLVSRQSVSVFRTFINSRLFVA